MWFRVSGFWFLVSRQRPGRPSTVVPETRNWKPREEIMKMKKTLLAFGCLLLAVTVGRPSSLPPVLVTPGAKGPDAGHWGVAVRLTMITDLAIARLFASRIPAGELDRQQSDRTVRATGQAPVPPAKL